VAAEARLHVRHRAISRVALESSKPGRPWTGAIDDHTVVATTVHPLQVMRDALPVTAHDFRLDLVVTPEEIILTDRSGQQPMGILEDHLARPFAPRSRS
jgi:hypothetical protein